MKFVLGIYLLLASKGYVFIIYVIESSSVVANCTIRKKSYTSCDEPIDVRSRQQEPR